MILKREASAILRRCRKDPSFFAREVLGVALWSEQVSILEAVRDHGEVVVASCHGAGKTYDAAVAMLWFLYSWPQSIVLTTAPTERQVRNQLWREIATIHNRAKMPLGGEVLTENLELEKDWWALGFTAPDYDQDRFQGFHADRILVVADEAAGIGRAIYEGIDGVLSSGTLRRLLMIGNPTDPESEFARRFQSGAHPIRISAFDTPNFTAFGIRECDIADGTWRQKQGNADPPQPHLILPEWVAEQYRRWGPESTAYVSRIRAEFPTDSADSFISLRLVHEAQRRNLESSGDTSEDESDNPPDRVELGVDVARFGADQTVIYSRRGSVIRLEYRGAKRDTMETVGRVIEARKATGATVIKVDVGGVGAGVVDRLKELGEPVTGIEFGGRALDPDLYPNRRCEMYGAIKRMLELGELDLPDDPEVEQIAWLRWKPDSRGRPQLESKDALRKRGRSSPDDADAIVLSLTPGTPRLELF